MVCPMRIADEDQLAIAEAQAEALKAQPDRRISVVLYESLRDALNKLRPGRKGRAGERKVWFRRLAGRFSRQTPLRSGSGETRSAGCRNGNERAGYAPNRLHSSLRKRGKLFTSWICLWIWNRFGPSPSCTARPTAHAEACAAFR